MKSKDQKRKEALERLRSTAWEKSRAKRLGTKTKEAWEEEKAIQIEELR